MAHHKRGRPKSSRAGCLMCKPWKHQRGAGSYSHKASDLRRDVDARQQLREVQRAA
jgi:hypothetical protein